MFRLGVVLVAVRSTSLSSTPGRTLAPSFDGVFFCLFILKHFACKMLLHSVLLDVTVLGDISVLFFVFGGFMSLLDEAILQWNLTYNYGLALVCDF